MSIFSGILAKVAANEKLDAPASGRVITPARLQQLSAAAATEFQRVLMNWLSCFRLQGALYDVLRIEMEDEGIKGLVEAVTSGNERGATKALYDAQVTALVQLWRRSALKRFQLVDEIPDEATEEFARVVSYADSLKAPATAPKAAVAAALVVEEPVETPLERTVREYHELPTQVFRKCYQSGPNRALWDQAAAENLL